MRQRILRTSRDRLAVAFERAVDLRIFSSCRRRVERRIQRLPVEEQFGECARIHDRARQDMRADLGTLFDHAHADFVAALRGDGLEAYQFDGSDADPGLEQALGAAEAIVVSIPPRDGAGARVDRFGPVIAGAPALRRIVYYSTIGVYGDHAGEWVDETSATRTRTARGRARLEDEARWTAAARARGAEADILRLAGIYGPGRNALANLRRGEARRIVTKLFQHRRNYCGEVELTAWCPPDNDQQRERGRGIR